LQPDNSSLNKVTALADMDPIQHVVPNVIEATNKAKNHGKAIGEAFIEGFMEPSFATDALADIMDRAISLILAIRTKGQSLLKTSSKGSKSKMSFWP
jgi:hypothetical protein